MICGALQTLNEDAFEDVSERPSPTGELIVQQYSLAPITEELGSPTHSRNCENPLNNSHLTTPNNNRYDDPSSNPTIIYIPNYSPSLDDTRL